jgi:16S rRNA (guanine527-N7)-methyltransferase
MREPGESDDRALALRQMNVSRETADRLDIYVSELRKWCAVTNLLSNSAWTDIWSRHIADSAQLDGLAPNAKTWIDLGSGAGFPGLVVAILRSHLPGTRVHLIESDKRKAAFLVEATRLTAAPCTIHNNRIEAVVKTIDPAPDTITARALAPMRTLVDLAAPLLARGSVALFLKGKGIEAELTDVDRSDRFLFEILPSRTSPSGCIVKVAQKPRHCGTDK